MQFMMKSEPRLALSCSFIESRRRVVVSVVVQYHGSVIADSTFDFIAMCHHGSGTSTNECYGDVVRTISRNG